METPLPIAPAADDARQGATGSGPEAGGEPAHYPEWRWLAMSVLLAAAFMNLMDVTIVNVALHSLLRAFDATPAQVEWVVASYLLVYALGLLPGGRLGDIFGRRRIFVIGVGVFTLGSTLCGLAPGIGTLVAARFIQGFGAALMTPQTLAIVPALFPPAERGGAFAFFGLSASMAAVTGPTLGGFLIDQNILGLDWRPIFLVNVPVGLITIFATMKLVPKVAGFRRMRIDYGGILLATVTLLAVIFPLIEGRQWGWPWWLLAILAASLPLAAGFLRWEWRQQRRGRAQLLSARLLANRSFLLGTMASLLLSTGLPGFFMVFAVFLQSGFALSPFESGATTIPFPLGVMTASLVASRIGNRLPRTRIVVGVLMLAGAMIVLRLNLGAITPGGPWPAEVWAFAPALFAGGFGLGSSMPPLYQVVLANIPSEDTGAASGAIQAFQQVGGAVGVAIIGQIFFSVLATAGGDSAGYVAALGLSLIYNSTVFILVAAMIWLVPAHRADL